MQQRRRTQLDERLKEVAACAAAGSLPEVTVTNGVLKVTPISKVTPPEADRGYA